MDKKQALLALCKQDFKAYCALVHHNRWIAGKAVSYLADRLQNFVKKDTGHAYDILLISFPPQHGKSMTVTETFPSWYLTNYPRNRVIEISYSEDFAQLFGRRNRQKMIEFSKSFGVSLCESPNSNVEFETTEGGGMISRGITSGVTGRPCDLMIIDDPIKNRLEANSEVFRDRIWSEWQDSFKTRLAAGAKVIVIQTRWHEDDLYGRLLRNEPNVERINLSCEAEENDPIGREKGDALCPEIGKDNSWLKDLKSSYADGSTTFQALYQGHPSLAEGNILQREWWRRYEIQPEEFHRLIISVDAAFKGEESSDYVAITVWGKTHGPDIYLLDLIHRQMDFVDTVEAILHMTEKYPKYNAMYVEDKANGAAIISVLHRKIHGVIGVNPMGGKISRVNAISDIVEAGNVYIPNTSWGDAFIEECAVFPRGAHDDMVDSMSQCLMREYYKKSFVSKAKTVNFASSQYRFGVKNYNDDILGIKIPVRAF